MKLLCLTSIQDLFRPFPDLGKNGVVLRGTEFNCSLLRSITYIDIKMCFTSVKSYFVEIKYELRYRIHCKNSFITGYLSDQGTNKFYTFVLYDSGRTIFLMYQSLKTQLSMVINQKFIQTEIIQMFPLTSQGKKERNDSHRGDIFLF